MNIFYYPWKTLFVAMNTRKISNMIFNSLLKSKKKKKKKSILKKELIEIVYPFIGFRVLPGIKA